MSASAIDHERLDRRLIATLCLAAAAGMINHTALGPFIPAIAIDFNSTVPVIGQIAALTALVSAVAGVFAGPLADHYGHRRVLAVSLILTMISALFVAAAQGYWWLVLGRVIGGLGFSASIGVAFALATLRYGGKARLAAMSILTSSLSISGIVGIPILTQIAGPFSWRGAWVFIACLALSSLVLLLLTVPASLSTGEGHFRLRHLVTAYAPLLQDSKVRWLFSGSVLLGAFFAAALTYSGSYFIEELGLSVQQFGLVATITGLGFFAGSLVAGKLGGFDLRSTFVVSSVVSGILLFVAYTVAGTVAVTVAALTIAFFCASIQAVNVTTLISNETPGGQGTAMVMNEATFAVGAAIGASTGGLLIQIGGFTALGIGIPVYALLAALTVWRPGSRRTSDATAAVAPSFEDR